MYVPPDWFNFALGGWGKCRAYTSALNQRQPCEADGAGSPLTLEFTKMDGKEGVNVLFTKVFGTWFR